MGRIITINDIRNLRKEGKCFEATKLLKQYHAEVRQQRKKDKLQEEKDYIQSLKDKGICTNCKKRKAFHGNLCNHCSFMVSMSKSKTKSVYRYEAVGKDRFDVFKDGKFAHRVSLNPLYCTNCKGFQQDKKLCRHIRFILSQLEDKGGIFR